MKQNIVFKIILDYFLFTFRERDAIENYNDQMLRVKKCTSFGNKEKVLSLRI